MAPRNSIDVEFYSSQTAAVTLGGEHDLATSDQLSLAFAIVGGCPFILLDLLEATFVDSSTIKAILRANRIAREHDGALELVIGEYGTVRRALEMSGVPTLVPFHETRRQAFASLSAAVQLLTRVPSQTLTADVADSLAAARSRHDADRAGVVIRAHVEDAAERRHRAA